MEGKDMYTVNLDIRDFVYYLAGEIERLTPFGYDFNSESMWELFDDCFITPELQNYKDTDIYDGYSRLIPTDVIQEVFGKLSQGINKALNFRINPKYRYSVPDSVYYTGGGGYKLYWRRVDDE